MARALWDPRGIEDVFHDTLLRKDGGDINSQIFLRPTGKLGNPIEWGEDCPTSEVDITTLDVPKHSNIKDWIQAIVVAAEGRSVVHFNGSKAEGGTQFSR